jgi:hypothetical protein
MNFETLFADAICNEPQPTPEQLATQPNTGPDDDAYGYCDGCGRRYGAAEWGFHWCPPCKTFHKSCPHCEVPLESTCMGCGSRLEGAAGDDECSECHKSPKCPRCRGRGNTWERDENGDRYPEHCCDCGGSGLRK